MEVVINLKRNFFLLKNDEGETGQDSCTTVLHLVFLHILMGSKKDITVFDVCFKNVVGSRVLFCGDTK